MRLLLAPVLVSSFFTRSIEASPNGLRSQTDKSRQLSAVEFLVVVGQAAPKEGFILGKCEGDCDSDNDCAPNLECYQRMDDEPVPGCTGITIGRRAIDFCYDPTDTFIEEEGTISFQEVSEAITDGIAVQILFGEADAVTSILSTCQGDCDGDATCATGLKCMERSRNENVPGCSGITGLQYGIDICYDPTLDPNYVAPIPSTLSPTLSPVLPPVLPPVQPPIQETSGKQGKCAGNCDSNLDCQSFFVCYEGSGDVPGCGYIAPGQNVCVDPADIPTRYGSDDSWSMKLYWQLGYNWQDELFERKWCVKCHGSQCNKDDSLFLTGCGDGESKFNFRNKNGKTSQFQITGTNLCLEMRPESRRVFVDDCDDNNDGQHFTSGLGNFDGARFELMTPLQEGCLTQHHWPKFGEIVFRDTCDIPRNDKTSFWNPY